MRLLVLAAASIALFAPRGGHAECAPPRPTFAPWSEAVLPADPTIYVLVPRALGGGTFTAGRVPLRVERIGSGRISDAFRIHLLLDHGDVTVRYDRSNVHAEATYSVRGSQTSHVARVANVSHIEDGVCPYANVIGFVVQGDAIALRIDWRDSGERLLLPGYVSEDGYLSTGVGYSSCSGWDALIDHARSFDLVALFADGTESYLGSSKLRIDKHDATVPVDLVQPYASDALRGRWKPRGTLEPRELELDVNAIVEHWLALVVAIGGLFALLGATYYIPARARIARRRSSDAADQVLSRS